ncbi:MAG TPA: carboxypeptidase regulatory-like domain-containing protein [Kofleriaceae bacterium]|jgi:protocatechuate 3,4-dioxygenase beta subunit
MKRVVAVVVVLAVVGFIAWRFLGHGTSGTHVATGGSNSAQSGATSTGNIGVTPRAKVDPRTQPVASIAGTVKGDKARPVDKATVCISLYSDELPPDFLADGLCTTSDASGAYKFEKLFAADYTIVAGAPHFIPETFHPDGDRTKDRLHVHAGENKTGVDVVLRSGGVEVTGIVSDIGGGPIAKARVEASSDGWARESSPTVETDATGAYSVWVAKGSVTVTARAEGYASGHQNTTAPGKADILLTPESSLSGTVVDAKSGKPVEGADVTVDRTDSWAFGSQSARSDAKGAFRVTKLVPGRYSASVKDETGIGQSSGSVLVGLGQNVDGVVVKVWPAARVIGKVLRADTKQVCEDASLQIHSGERNVWQDGKADADGTITINAVLPGTYTVSADCPGFIDPDEKKTIVVADKDVTGVTVTVSAGGRIIGKITRKDGTPVASAAVRAAAKDVPRGAKEGWGFGTSAPDGTYELRSLRAYTYSIDVISQEGVPPKDPVKLAVQPGATVTQDFTLDDGGSIVGTVEDQDGKPVQGVSINASSMEQRNEFWGGNRPMTDAAGAFTVDQLRPGKYSVYATKGDGWKSLRKPGTTDDDKQTETVTVEVGKASKVKLVVEKPNGTITGTVVDSTGAPVTDAFVSSARESDAKGSNGSAVESTRDDWWGGGSPELTSTEGAFTLKDLTPGNYTVRAYRKGGGEGVVEHIAVGTTGAKVAIRETGSITGSVTGTPPDTMTIHLEDGKNGFSRDETFFRTAGAFDVHDLPPGHYKITASGESGHGQTELDLAGNENKTGVVIEMEELLTLTGRIVDIRTKAGVANMRLSASAAGAGYSFSFGDEDDDANLSDATGAFTIKRAPKSKLSIMAISRDFKDAKYPWAQAFRDATNANSSTFDIGEIHVAEKSVPDGAIAGDPGLRFKDRPPGANAWEVSLEVSFIDPKGPAVASGIKVGDTIVSVDGFDVTGDDKSLAFQLMTGPVGKTETLGLARGATVTLTLAAPQ